MAYTPTNAFAVGGGYTPTSAFVIGGGAQLDDVAGGGAIDSIVATITRQATLADAGATGSIDAFVAGIINVVAVLADVSGSGEIDDLAAILTLQATLADATGSASIDAVAATIAIVGSPADVAAAGAIDAIAVAIIRPSTLADATGHADADAFAAQVSVYVAAAHDAIRWSAKVMLNGVDVSPKLTGQIQIEAEESAARVADFTLMPDPGVLDLAAYTQAAVTIDYLLQEEGTTIGAFRRFTGVVDVPDYNRTDGTIRFSCTDNLQRVFEGQGRAFIASMTGGQWSPFVFNADADSWTYAQDRMSTQSSAFDLDVYAQPVKTPWQAKATADYEFTQDDLIDGMLTITTPSARNLVNTFAVTLEYRFERLLQREVAYGFAPPSIRYIDGMSAPTPQQIAQAMHSAGWALENDPVFSPVPNPGSYVNSEGGSIFYLSDCPRYTYAGAATFVLAKRWTQTVTETHNLNVAAPVSVAAVGALQGADHVAISAGDLDRRPEDWDKTREDTVDIDLKNGSHIGGPCSAWVEMHSLGVMRHATPTPSGLSSFAATGDKYLDLDDRDADGREAFQGAFRAAAAQARAKILASHRGGTVEASILLNPLLDRTHTVRVVTDKETAKGKVIRVKDTIDIDAGSAVTEFAIAISQAFGVSSVTPTPIDDPPKPEMSQEEEPFDPATAGDLPSYFVAGGDAEMTDDQQGWSPQLDEFRLFTPSVDGANINHATVTANYSFDVAIPEDEFVVEV